MPLGYRHTDANHRLWSKVQHVARCSQLRDWSNQSKFIDSLKIQRKVGREDETHESSAWLWHLTRSSSRLLLVINWCSNAFILLFFSFFFFLGRKIEYHRGHPSLYKEMDLFPLHDRLFPWCSRLSFLSNNKASVRSTPQYWCLAHLVVFGNITQ